MARHASTTKRGRMATHTSVSAGLSTLATTTATIKYPVSTTTAPMATTTTASKYLLSTSSLAAATDDAATTTSETTREKGESLAHSWDHCSRYHLWWHYCQCCTEYNSTGQYNGKYCRHAN